MPLNLTSADFGDLWATCSEWRSFRHSFHLQDKQGRFITEGPHSLSFFFLWAYWFNTPADRILAATFLQDKGERFQKVFDSAYPAPYLLLTDYQAHERGE